MDVFCEAEHAHDPSRLRHQALPAKAARLGPSSGSYATPAPTWLTGRRQPRCGLQNRGGHVTETLGHVPEFGGHDAEMVGQGGPKYAIANGQTPFAVVQLLHGPGQVASCQGPAD